MSLFSSIPSQPIAQGEAYGKLKDAVLGGIAKCVEASEQGGKGGGVKIEVGAQDSVKLKL